MRLAAKSSSISRWPARVATLGLTGCKGDDTIKIGLVTALSAQSAQSGEAITRGLTIAIDEINAAGGIGGRKLVLVSRDDESNPAKGVIAARELIHKEGVAILFGGLDTPVARAIVPIATEAKIPFVIPWAAGTAITHNGTDPNYVFRVLGRRRAGRQGDGRLRTGQLRHEEARPDPARQSLGPVQRGRPQGRARRSRPARGGLGEVRDVGHRPDAPAWPPCAPPGPTRCCSWRR